MPMVRESEERMRRTITTMLVTGFFALSGVIATAAVLMVMNQNQMGWIRHTYETERRIAEIRLDMARLGRISRARFMRLPERSHTRGHAVGDEAPPPPPPADQVAAIHGALSRAIAELDEQTRDNPRQQARMTRLIAATTQAEMQARNGKPLDETAPWLDPDPAALVLRICDAMASEESHLLALRDARKQVLDQGFTLILAMTGVLLAIVGALTWTAVRSHTRALALSRLALRDANEGLEAAVQERTAELQRANSEIQRFAYIVSHDLRSPLVNVMGFTAELEAATNTLREALEQAMRDRPETVAPGIHEIITDELPEAIHFIRTSTQKMDRLINAILHLSRMGRRPLSPEWLDLAQLVRAVSDTLRKRLDEVEGTITAVEPMPEILGDRTAIEQILANLIENSIKYRHSSRAPLIRVTATRRDAWVMIAVSDNGRGIDPRDHERVFDLFRRSGAQDQPGEGIGLAHVRALAHRLGGTVRVESVPGTGSTFTVTLPVHFQAEQSSPS